MNILQTKLAAGAVILSLFAWSAPAFAGRWSAIGISETEPVTFIDVGSVEFDVGSVELNGSLRKRVLISSAYKKNSGTDESRTLLEIDCAQRKARGIVITTFKEDRPVESSILTDKPWVAGEPYSTMWEIVTFVCEGSETPSMMSISPLTPHIAAQAFLLKK